jgi:zinc protease
MTPLRNTLVLLCALCASVVNVLAQTEQPPAPSAPKSVTVPAVKETKLKNGLGIAVIERKSSPLVTVFLLLRSGAAAESDDKAGLANLTADMLTKGTKTRTATQIAEEMEFLGGSLNSSAGWNNSFVSITVTPDKLDKAMAILADVVLNPAFKQEELDLLKTQALDGLTYNLKQPSFLANYVASKYSFGEHPAGGTPASISSITTADITQFHSGYFKPEQAVLIFAGDTSSAAATALGIKFFGNWTKRGYPLRDDVRRIPEASEPRTVMRRLLVVDLPNSGQASVVYSKPTYDLGRKDPRFYSATVLNSVLGGGYSSRLNYEIRIKRGLSYGAGSSFAWRASKTNFATRTQTKNESAAEVVELVLAEVKRLMEGAIPAEELTPRKSVLTGGFGRNLETTNGLASAAADLYSFGIPASELNKYVDSVNAVTDGQIRDFAKQNLLGGDVIIVGDYSVFKDDLAKRFPNIQVQVVKADRLDLSKLR